MLDEAMLDTRKFWFIEPTGQLQTWRPVLNEYQSPKIRHLAQMEYHTLRGDYHRKTAIQFWKN